MGKSSIVVRSFETDQEFSESEEATEFWAKFYRAAFPDFIEMSDTIKDLTRQKRGIDREVRLGNGDVILVDEKLRRIYKPDIFLEYQSNDIYHTPGWLNKDLDIDFIAYAWYPVKLGYLFEWQSLTSAWFQYGQQWMAKHPRMLSENEGYGTLGVCVPTSIIVPMTSARCVIIQENQKRVAQFEQLELWR